MDKSNDDASKASAWKSGEGRSAQSQTTPSRPALDQEQSPDPSRASGSAGDSGVAFKSDYIGQWAAKQDDPFAEQNRKAAEQKAAKEAARKKALPYVKIGSIIAACAAVVAIIVVVVVAIVNRPKPEVPTIAGDSSEDISNYVDILQNKYNESQNVEDVSEIINNTLNTNNGREYEAQVRLAEMVFYFDNDLYQQLVDTGLKIDPMTLQPDQRLRYYNYMRYGYSVLNDNDKAAEYMDLVFELSNELSGNRPSGGG